MLRAVDKTAQAKDPGSDQREPTRVRLAAVGDLHCGRYSPEVLHALLQRAATDAEVLLLCGDLVDHGLLEEARTLARELATIGTPTVAVLGNHDVEAGKEAEIVAILADVGVHVLDGDSITLRGVGIAGVKGFAGGFGAHALGAWGEAAIKTFVHEAVEEALKLEAALSRLNGGPRVAVLHYSPIAATLQGEATEIYPFLGSSRLEEPLNRFGVDMVVPRACPRRRARGTDRRRRAGVQRLDARARARLSGPVAGARRRDRGAGSRRRERGAAATTAPAIAEGV